MQKISKIVINGVTYIIVDASAAHIDDSSQTTAAWSAQKILAMIAQGGLGNINMVGRSIWNVGSIETQSLSVSPDDSEGFSIESALENSDWSSPVAVFSGTNNGESVIIRHIASGTQEEDAVNKGQLDEALAEKAKIDDTKVDTDAWSSQKIVDTFGVPFNSNGTVVQVVPVSDGVEVSVSTDDFSGDFIKLYCTGKNLVSQNPDDYVHNTYIIHTSGNEYSGSSTSICSRFVPVAHLRGKTLSLNGAYVTGSNPGYAFYDTEKNYIAGGRTKTFTVPTDAFYLRFTIKKTEISSDGSGNDNTLEYDKIQLEIGDEVSSIEKYKEINFDPSENPILLKRGFLAGMNTFYAYIGRYTNGIFWPVSCVNVKVECKSNPVWELEVQKKQIQELKEAVLAMGANV